MTFVFKTGVTHQGLPLHGTHMVFVSLEQTMKDTNAADCSLPWSDTALPISHEFLSR